MAAVLGLALFIAFAIGFVNPFAGLLGLLAVNVIQPGELYPVFNTLHVERLSAIFVLVSLLLHHRGHIRLKNPMSRQAFFFWGALFASVPLAYWRMNALGNAFGFYRTVFYFLLITNLVDTIPRLKKLIVVYIALNAWLAITSYWAFAHGDVYLSSTFDRAEGLTSSGGDPNRLGITLVAGIPFAALFLFYGKIRLRVLAVATIAISLIVLVMTGSRTSFIGFAALLIAFAITRRKKFILIPLAALLIVGIFIAVPAQYQKRYLSVENRDQDISYMNRIRAWHAGLKMMEHNPLTGVGVGNFADANGAEYWPGTGRKVWLQPHSLYVQVGAELGIVGVIAFGWFLWSLFQINRKIRNDTKKSGEYPKWLQYFPTACNFSLFVLLFTGYSSHSLYRSTWFLLAAMSACAYSLTRPETQETAPVEEKHPALKSWDTVPVEVTR